MERVSGVAERSRGMIVLAGQGACAFDQRASASGNCASNRNFTWPARRPRDPSGAELLKQAETVRSSRRSLGVGGRLDDPAAFPITCPIVPHRADPLAIPFLRSLRSFAANLLPRSPWNDPDVAARERFGKWGRARMALS